PRRGRRGDDARRAGKRFARCDDAFRRCGEAPAGGRTEGYCRPAARSRAARAAGCRRSEGRSRHNRKARGNGPQDPPRSTACEEELMPPRHSAVDTQALSALLSAEGDEDAPVLADPWAFFSGVLGWDARFVAGAPGGPETPDSLAVKVPEQDVTLMPDWAARE